MRCSRCCADDTRVHRLTAVEEFNVNLLRRHAHGCERLFHVCHEPSRPAEVDFCVSWYADLVEDRPRQVTCCVEILTHLVEQARLAVAHITAAMREREHEATNFRGECMMFPIASRVQP